jgi:hypothetical protein
MLVERPAVPLQVRMLFHLVSVLFYAILHYADLRWVAYWLLLLVVCLTVVCCPFVLFDDVISADV